MYSGRNTHGAARPGTDPSTPRHITACGPTKTRTRHTRSPPANRKQATAHRHARTPAQRHNTRGDAMNLMDILSKDCVAVPLNATDKKGVVDELVDTLHRAGEVDDPASLKHAVWTRETTRTTGIGHALAIPHGKCESVHDLAMAVGKPAEPIDFASIDGKPVQLVVLLASPLDRTSDHIQALARISRLMAGGEFREKMYAATSSEELYDLLEREESASSSA